MNSSCLLFLCDLGTIITSGEGILDVRIGMKIYVLTSFPRNANGISRDSYFCGFFWSFIQKI